MLYIFGILAAFLATITHAWGNILDNYFSSKIFNRLTNLIFFSTLVNLIFLPIVLIVDFPKPLSLGLLAIAFLIALMDILYSYPYYWSLRRMDTSVITSLFSLGKIFAPVLAFFIVREHLAPIQYIGFFLIILSSIFLTLDFKKLRFDRAFLFMFIVSIILTLQSVLYKYMFDQGTSWGTAVVWTTLLSIAVALVPALFPKNIADMRASVQKIKGIGWLFFLNQFLSWGGEAANTLALFLIPVSIVKGITSTQPIFVLIFALLFAKNAKHVFREYTGSDGLWKKIILFILTIIGTLLVIGG